MASAGKGRLRLRNAVDKGGRMIPDAAAGAALAVQCRPMNESRGRGPLRRPDLLVALALLALAALGVGRGMLPGRTPLPLDILGLFEPWRLNWPTAGNPVVGDTLLEFSSRIYMGRSLQDGHFPLWNPTIMAGQPQVGDTHSSPFYPLLLALAWCCHPLTAFRLQLLLQLWLGGLFMCLWMRGLRLGRLPAAAAGAAWILAGYHQVWMSYLPFTGTLCWLPAIPAAWEAARQAGGRRALAAGALAAAMAIMAGQLQFFLYGGLLLGIYGLARLAASPPGERRRGLGAGAVIAVGGLALGAVHVLPTYAVALDTIRPAFSWAALRQTGLPWRQLATMVAPWLLGHPGRGDYIGAQNASELMAYLGLVPLLGALTAFAIRRDRLAGLFSALSLLVLALALATPLAWPLAYLPWLQRFGLMRWLGLLPLVAIPLLALALDAAATDDRAVRTLRRALPLAAVVAAGALLAVARTGPVAEGQVAPALGWLGAAVLVMLLWAGRPRSAARGAALLALLAAEPLMMGRGYTPSASTADYFPPLAPVDRLAAERAREPFRVAAFQGGVIALGPSVAPSLGLEEIGGYTSSVRESYRRFLATLSSPSDNGSLAQNPNMVTMGDAAPLLLRMLDVRYVLAAHELPSWSRILDGATACARTRTLGQGEQLGATVLPWAEGFNRVDVAVASGGPVAVHVVARFGATEHLAYGELPAGDGPIRSLYFEPIADSAERPFYVYVDRPGGATGPPPELCLDGDGPALGLGARASPYPLAFSANGLNVYRAPISLGRAWLVGSAEAVPDFGAVLARLSRGQLDPARTVLLEAPQLAAAGDWVGLVSTEDHAGLAGSAGSMGSIGPRGPIGLIGPIGPMDASRPAAVLSLPATNAPQVHDEGPNQRRISLPPGSAGWLMVSEAWDAGWRAEVDGAPTPVLRGDGGLMAVPLGPAGAREVRLRFLPTSVLVGLAISLAGLVGVLGLVLGRRIRLA
jgi:hypothetical protein